MSISKEIFGIEKKQNISSNSEYYNIHANGWNDLVKEIDQYELSEEELAKVIMRFNIGTTDDNDKKLAKSIKENQSKLFVRKNK